MLSEKQIEKLIAPLIERQNSINTYVISLIAERIKEIGEVLPSDVYKLQQLFNSGVDVKRINTELASLTSLQVQEIKDIIKIAAEDVYLDAKPFYDYRKKSFIPLARNKQLQDIIKSISNETVETFLNLSNSQGFMIRDLKNPSVLKPTTLSRTYQSIIDEAIQASQSGVTDYHTAMRRSMEQLSNSGIRYIEYDTKSGRRYTQRMDTAVKRNILDGIKAINQGVQDEVGKQFGSDGKEISVHGFSAPDHEPIQGHQFTNEEFEKLQSNEPFEDVLGNKFDAIERPIGMWNCRHYTFSIVLGVSKPLYTPEQLDVIMEQNAKGYTDKEGNHYTMYECTQVQRKLETNIRRAKDNQITLKNSGDIKGAKKWQAKVTRLQKEYQTFSSKCGLRTQIENLFVEGYRKIV